MAVSPRVVRQFASFGALRLTLVLATGAMACGDGGTGPGTEPPVASIQVTPGQDTLAALGATRQFQAVARDASGAVVGGVEFTWSAGDEAVARVDAVGLVEAVGNGLATISASAGGVTGAAELAVRQQVTSVVVTPATAILTTVGATQQFAAEATDANGAAVEGSPFVWSSEDHTVATVSPAGVVTAKGSGQVTITATAQDIPGHGSLSVNQAIDHLAFLSDPTTATAGEAFDPAIQVEVRDAGGARVADAGIAITLSIDTDSGGGTLTGTKTVHAINGVASFSGLWIDRAGTGYTLAGSGTAANPATSAAFDIRPAAAESLGVLEAPEERVAGEPLGVSVGILDAFGNVVDSADGTITLELSAGPEEGALVGTATETAVNGVARFDAVSVQRAGSGYAVAAEGAGFPAVESEPFRVVAAAPHQLGFANLVAPSGRARAALQHLAFAVQDTFGNVVDTSTARVELTIEGTFPASITGALAANAADGIATFEDVVIDRPGIYDLWATATDLRQGTGTAHVLLLPPPGFGGTTGAAHTCVLTSTGAFCWGANTESQLGRVTDPVGDSVALGVDSDLIVQVVSAGTGHTCAVDFEDTAYCWGGNASGQLGDGNAGTTQAAPVPVAGGVAFATVSAGDEHTCAVSTTGRAYCWGANDQGQLGTGAAGAASDVPVLVTDTLVFQAVTAGTDHTCGLAVDGPVYCWGDNARGQLGDGNLGTDSASPVRVLGFGFNWIDAGANHTCGINGSGNVFCWGAGDAGQLGDGGTADSDVQVKATESTSDDDINRFRFRVSAGASHTCIVKGPTEGLWCWGDNSSGQLGGTGGFIPGTDNVVWNWVAAGAQHTCAYADDLDGLIEPPAFMNEFGEGLYCWGANSNGQLGVGNTIFDASSPTRVVQGY